MLPSYRNTSWIVIQYVKFPQFSSSENPCTCERLMFNYEHEIALIAILTIDSSRDRLLRWRIRPANISKSILGAIKNDCAFFSHTASIHKKHVLLLCTSKPDFIVQHRIRLVDGIAKVSFKLPFERLQFIVFNLRPCNCLNFPEWVSFSW